MPHSKKSFLQLYQKRERVNRLKESVIEINEEIEITSNELVSEDLRSKGQKRKYKGLDDNEKRIPKYFSNITALMSFTWCEKKDKESATSIFFVTQEKSSTTLLDGIGINNKKFPCMVLESSGLKVTTDINHLLKDSVKNIKTATDALKNIICRFPNASMNTVKVANVYSIQIIQTKMTLIKYSLKDKDTFKAIECSSALIPCSFEERIHLMSVFDIFAYLYNDLSNQLRIFEKLEAEQLGLTEVADEEMICFTNDFLKY
ncbi:uncharacterized protein BX663DRAFT_506428 [Cokeromyces recurvatus]|uniref:uncharacterized protein n=1 Tax=Cokeromyces recurvatus TaxID=90255 RepID=UPI0022201024|nr:uncharacterized protein BX663DRAFT_506428 [Cokeromyces recurvatus]KAI7904105.1 hypothetical protein BX663DRAFT_506428 [Cokeromyces recurvatus]